MNNERMQLTYLDVFNNLNAKNIYASGVNTNQLDLNSIDVLSISGVDISIISGNVTLTNRPTVNGLGVVLSGEINPIIVNTGSLLNNKINSLSGYLNFQDIAFSGQISNTGSKLDNKINSLSGYVNDQNIIFSGQIASTGSSLYNSILSLSGLFTGYTGSLNANFATDAQLFTTGSILDNKINSLSGYVNSQDNLFSGQIFNTGSSLDNKINSLSGVSVLKFGNQNIGGNKTFTGIITFSGQQINVIDTALNLSGVGDMTFDSTNINFINSPVFISGTNLRVTGDVIANNLVYNIGNQTISGIKTFANNLEIQGTGIFNALDLSNISEFNFSGTNINLVNGNVNISGGTVYISGNAVLTGVNLNAYATTANLFATGSTLDNKINSLSGYFNFQDILFSGQTFNTGSRLDNKINSLSGYVDSKSITLPTTIVYTTGDQIISGNKTFINNIAVSGTGNFNNVKVSNIDKLYISGVDVLVSNMDNLFLSGVDIVVTGNSSINIYNPIYISGNPVLTGIDSSSYATISNLFSTGSNLSNKINSLSGYVNSQDILFSGQIADTGSRLDNKINSLSGVSVLIFGDQNIGGNKTFNVAPILSGSKLITGVNLNNYTTKSLAIAYAIAL